jgi:hypothetical protein
VWGKLAKHRKKEERIRLKLSHWEYSIPPITPPPPKKNPFFRESTSGRWGNSMAWWHKVVALQDATVASLPQNTWCLQNTEHYESIHGVKPITRLSGEQLPPQKPDNLRHTFL